MKFDINVKKVLVTGGSSGIGFAVAKALLNEGCDVCICGRDITKLEKANLALNSPNVSTIEWDLTNTKIMSEKINESACKCGGFLDGLVSCAGVYNNKSWYETDDIWDSIWDTNLKAQIFLMRKFTFYLLNNRLKGNLLFISSIGSLMPLIDNSYEASKYTLNKMLRGHARKVLSQGIVINGIMPGVVTTPMTNNVTRFDQCAIKRALQPDEIASLALFLLSKQASICSGELLDASGGFFNAV